MTPPSAARLSRYKSIIAPQKCYNQLTYIIALSAESREVTIAFNFVSERTLFHTIRKLRLKAENYVPSWQQFGNSGGIIFDI
jgi:hypothetical protein